MRPLSAARCSNPRSLGALSLGVPAETAAPLAAPPGCVSSRGILRGPVRQRSKWTGQSYFGKGGRVAGKHRLIQPPNSRQAPPKCAAALYRRIPGGLGRAAHPQSRAGRGQPDVGRGVGDAWDPQCGIPSLGSHWPRGRTCRPAPGPILGQYCPGGGRVVVLPRGPWTWGTSPSPSRRGCAAGPRSPLSPRGRTAPSRR